MKVIHPIPDTLLIVVDPDSDGLLQNLPAAGGPASVLVTAKMKQIPVLGCVTRILAYGIRSL